MSVPKLDFNLQVTVLKEGEAYVAYSPALDISTAGDTFEEAKQRFGEAVSILFEEIVNEGTLEDVLLELGWTKKNKSLMPPVVVANQLQKFSFTRLLPAMYA